MLQPSHAIAQEAFLMSQAVGLFSLAALVAPAGELTHFLVHDELHQLQSGLPHQVTDALLQGGGDFLERQVELQGLLALLGALAELPDCILAVDLISFLHSDSPFERTKHHSEPTNGSAWRVAAFYGLSDILQRKYVCA